MRAVVFGDDAFHRVPHNRKPIIACKIGEACCHSVTLAHTDFKAATTPTIALAICAETTVIIIQKIVQNVKNKLEHLELESGTTGTLQLLGFGMSTLVSR